MAAFYLNPLSELDILLTDCLVRPEKRRQEWKRRREEFGGEIRRISTAVFVAECCATAVHGLDWPHLASLRPHLDHKKRTSF